MSQLVFDLPLITVHCFTCPYVVQDATPDGAHDAMERHYETKHKRLIDALVGAVS